VDIRPSSQHPDTFYYSKRAKNDFLNRKSKRLLVGQEIEIVFVFNAGEGWYPPFRKVEPKMISSHPGKVENTQRVHGTPLIAIQSAGTWCLQF